MFTWNADTVSVILNPGSRASTNKLKVLEGVGIVSQALHLSPFGLQVGRTPSVLVWSSSTACAEGSSLLKKDKATIATLVGHERKASSPTRLRLS